MDIQKILWVNYFFNAGIDELRDEINIGRMPDVTICGVNNAFGSDMKVEYQVEKLDDISGDEDKTVEVIDAEKIHSVEKIFNSGIEDISNKNIIGRMSDVNVSAGIDVTGCEMNGDF